MRQEIEDREWLEKVYRKVEATHSIGSLMSLVEKLEMPSDDEEEQKELLKYEDLYTDAEFVDDLSGAPLEKEAVKKARLLEMQFFRRLKVYSKVKREAWMKVISVKWLDVNKGDAKAPNYRSRLVGRELNLTKRDDLFAGTPPLESLRYILSRSASHKDHLVMAIDVKRAYFYAPATRAVYIEIPPEDRQPGDEGMVGKLNLSLYGTRDAALNWVNAYTRVLVKAGFEVGKHSAQNFYHRRRGVAVTVHGDDFTASGKEEDLLWLEATLGKEFSLRPKS